MRSIDYERMKYFLKFHEDMGYPYELERSNTRVYLKSSHAGEVMTSNEMLPMSQLIYIQMVRKYVIKKKIYEKIKKVDASEIKFYVYSNSVAVGSRYKDCYEIDLKSAYWETANMNRILDPGLYAKASTINPKTNEVFINKQVRLAALGSLAKVKRRYSFNGKKVKKRRSVKSNLTRHIWDFICLQTGKVMSLAAKASGNDFIFFWTDAIFVTSESAKKKVIRIFEQAGYKYSIKRIKSIEFQDRDIVVTDKEGKRPFPFSHRNR